jgi:hypothetical protein
MSFPHQPQNAAGGQPLANALDRLAAAFEQQTQSLLELRNDVADLAGGLRRIEGRLGEIERKQSAVAAPSPAPEKPKAAVKKRAK